MGAKRLRIPKTLIVLTLCSGVAACGDDTVEEEHCSCIQATDPPDAGAGVPVADAGFDDAGCAPNEELACFA